jgi:diguanylate cyclase (GGDEF)-like protein
VDRLKQMVIAQPFEVARVQPAVDALKSALLVEPGAGGQPCVNDWKEAEQQSKQLKAGEAARHVVLALLQGLRLGNATYDAFLEENIQRILRLLSDGEVRKAMSSVVDVIDRFRSVLDDRRQAAESALRDILRELLDAENDLTSYFDTFNQKMADQGSAYTEQMNASMGRLVVEIKQAKDLEGLKSRALNHIRALREQIRERERKEKERLEQSKMELASLRETLANTRHRMAKVERLRKKLREDALTDPMTGVWNKRALNERLADALSSRDMQPFGLIVFDIDYFKRINDTYGHQAGDKALGAIAAQTTETLRGSDVLFRYAGDEFVVLLPGTELAEAEAAAERVRQAAQAIAFTYRGKGEVRVSLSLGVTMNREGDDAESIFERADQALLTAKQQGRNRVQTAV